MNKLPEYKDYTVDFRLKEFRKVLWNSKKYPEGWIDYIQFDSDKGDKLLAEMIKKNLVPKEVLINLF